MTIETGIDFEQLMMAQDQGSDDFYEGVAFDECPFDKPQAIEAWRYGWNNAKQNEEN